MPQNKKQPPGEENIGGNGNRWGWIDGGHLLESCHGLLQVPSTDKGLGKDGQSDRSTHQYQLQGSVDFRDLRRLDFSRWKREIPVASHSLRWGERDPTVVDGRDSQANITTEDNNSQPHCRKYQVRLDIAFQEGPIVPGRDPFTAKQATPIVIRSLSAIGSMIVPTTVCRLYFRAIQPSTRSVIPA